MKTPDDRSPLKAKPLRVAGQSLDEAIQKLLDDDISEAVVLAVVGIVLAGYEWFRWFYSAPPQPLIISLCAAVLLFWAIWRVMRGRRTLRQLRQGRDGERAVAEVLERLREMGFRVFHDIVAPGFNVDHVLVGAQGLYAIETKTITKPASGKAKIQYDGENVTLAGFKPERDPVKQVTAIAKWLRDLVKESCGRDYRVRPVLLYPGWYTYPGVNRNKDAWVLNPKALRAFIEHEPTILQPEDVALVAFHLSRYARGAAET